MPLWHVLDDFGKVKDDPAKPRRGAIAPAELRRQLAGVRKLPSASLEAWAGTAHRARHRSRGAPRGLHLLDRGQGCPRSRGGLHCRVNPGRPVEATRISAGRSAAPACPTGS